MKTTMKMKERIARMKKENKAEFIMQIIAVIVFIALIVFFVIFESQQGKSKINMQMSMQMQEQNQEPIQEQIPQEKEIQKYIVRYGEVLSTTKILTEDGHEWNVIDFPQDDKYIRVLFDSKETLKADDDEIIDYTEDTREFRR